MDAKQKRETRNINLFSLMLFFSILAGLSNIIFLGVNFPILAEGLMLLGALAILFSNHKGYYNASSYLFVLALNLMLVYINLYYDKSTGAYLYYFPVIFCIALLYNPNKPAYRPIIFFGILILSFFISHYGNVPFIHNANISAEQITHLLTFNIFFSTLVTLVLVFMVISLINNQYLELTELLKRVQNDKVIIRNSLLEKEVLLAEIQHRVKNNLSVIIGLFNMQMNSTNSNEVRDSINEAKNRVMSIAMVHQKIYKKEDLSRINLKQYIIELVKEIVKSHRLINEIHINEELEDIETSVTQAVPIGLIANEIITNSLKHAFKDDYPDPTITIQLSKLFDKIILKINDNGPGFTDRKDHHERSIGLTLMESLAEQLDAQIIYHNEHGAVVELSIPFYSKT